MVHWPEVMVTYDSTDKVLFSADGFGKFGALDVEEDWDDEARRYFIGIVGKYGAQVQSLLKVAATLDIQIICPLHGPVLSEDLGHYIGLYDTWSSYTRTERCDLHRFVDRIGGGSLYVCHDGDRLSGKCIDKGGLSAVCFSKYTYMKPVAGGRFL